MRKWRSKLPTLPLKNYNFGNLGNFDLNFPIHFFPKSRCSCAQWKGNFLNFPKLTLLLSVVHLQGVLWAFKHKSHFFLGHPVDLLPFNPYIPEDMSETAWTPLPSSLPGLASVDDCSPEGSGIPDIGTKPNVTYPDDKVRDLC